MKFSKPFPRLAFLLAAASIGAPPASGQMEPDAFLLSAVPYEPAIEVPVIEPTEIEAPVMEAPVIAPLEIEAPAMDPPHRARRARLGGRSGRRSGGPGSGCRLGGARGDLDRGAGRRRAHSHRMSCSM